MAVIRQEKAAKVAEVQEQLKAAQCTILVDYCGLTVAQDTKLRKTMREAGIKYHVVKNTFIRIAAEEAGIEGLEVYLEKNTAIASSFEDPVVVAKVLSDFVKENKVMKIKAGVLDGKVITSDEIKDLANLPSREVLLSKMLGSMMSPVSGLANVLQGTIRNFVYVVEAVRKEKESA